LFQQYGQVIDVVVMRRNKMRGQAFVVYKRREEAELALKTLNGFKAFDKPLVLAMADKPSYAFIVDQGRFFYKNYQEKYHLRKAQVLSAVVGEDAQPSSDNQRKEKEVALEPLLPNSKTIILVENIPNDLNDDLFRFLFKQFPGLKHTKLAKEKGIGFAEFLSNAQAGVALKATNGFKIRENVILKVSFANTKSPEDSSQI
jgi:U2 small nuclear ribonucleoprotein B''